MRAVQCNLLTWGTHRRGVVTVGSAGTGEACLAPAEWVMEFMECQAIVEVQTLQYYPRRGTSQLQLNLL